VTDQATNPAPELLDPDLIRASLEPRERRVLNALEVDRNIDSTNDEMLRRGFEKFHGVALFAEQQEGGRGRRGRRWHSPFARNLYLSVGWRYEPTPPELAFLPLAVAVAMAEALESAGFPGAMLKWPNDLLLDGRKVGGILAESRRGAGDCRVVVGVGINVRMAGDPGAAEIGRPWTDLASRNPEVSRNAVAASVLGGVLVTLEGFADRGFAAFGERWAARDALRGRAVTLYHEGQALVGRARGLGPRGGLLLDTGEGSPREWFAGEITSHEP
jgi:BirA family biotin operon repressor/biotin-[acetyl-CoA-carboxylase] ligase